MEGNRKQFNMKNPAVKRILQEVKEMQRDPSREYTSMPVEEDIFEWQFAVHGPRDSEFEGGIYHGRIILPADYPFKPPAFMLLTPSGRFEVQTKICLSISAHHPEHWQPSWSVRTALLALIAFMPSKPDGAIGSLDYTKEERRILAIKSRLAPPKFGSPDRQNVINQIHETMMKTAPPVPEKLPSTSQQAPSAADATPPSPLPPSSPAPSVPQQGLPNLPPAPSDLSQPQAVPSSLPPSLSSDSTSVPPPPASPSPPPSSLSASSTSHLGNDDSSLLTRDPTHSLQSATVATSVVPPERAPMAIMDKATPVNLSALSQQQQQQNEEKQQQQQHQVTSSSLFHAKGGDAGASAASSASPSSSSSSSSLLPAPQQPVAPHGLVASCPPPSASPSLTSPILNDNTPGISTTSSQHSIASRSVSSQQQQQEQRTPPQTRRTTATVTPSRPSSRSLEDLGLTILAFALAAAIVAILVRKFLKVYGVDDASGLTEGSLLS